MADNIQLYQKKGNQLGIEGRINTRSYDNQQGQKVYVTEVIAENVQFLTPRNDFNEQNTLGVTNTYDAQSLTQQAEVDAFEIASDDLPF